MRSNLEQRIFRLEQAIDRINKQIRGLLDAVAQLQQQQAAAIPWGGGGGGTSSFYVAYPTSTVAAATWASGAPTSGTTFTSHVYKVSYDGTSQSIDDLGTQDCVNWLAAALAANKGCVVIRDSQGSYGVVTQVC